MKRTALFVTTTHGRAALVAAAICAAALPSYAETHALQPYAYVQSQSYGSNVVYTAYYARKDSKFVADFEFVGTDAGALFGANNDNGNIHGFYINGSKKIAWTMNGGWWWTTWNPGNGTIDPGANRRIVATVMGTGNTASMVYYADGTTYTSTIDKTKAFTTVTSSTETMIFQWLNSYGNNTRAKLYSFEADNDCTSGVPAAFFAPTVDADGNAGFTNIVAGTFHGEGNANSRKAMTFTDGIGSANDYKYESDTFYAKFYAYAADTDMGGVKFGDDAASGTASAWIARGGNATLTAVPAPGYAFTGWTGDTRAITSGSVNDATITVANDRAAQLLANFAAGPILTLAADASVAWSEAAWQTGGASASAPTSGDAIIVLSGDATVSLDCAVSLSSIRILGSGTLTIARGEHSYSVASIITDSDSGYLVTLSNGKIVFKYNDSGTIQELYMNPDPGETLTLDDGKLNFAAGAKIVPGQGGDVGGKSVIVGGFTAAGSLEFDGVTNMTWAGSNYLSNTPVTVFTNTRLDDIVLLCSYGKVGTGQAAMNDANKYLPYYIYRNGNAMGIELQRVSGTLRRAVFIELVQDGLNITGKILASCYKYDDSANLGIKTFTYNNGSVTTISGMTNDMTSSKNYQQQKFLVVGPRSGSASKLTFALSGTQTLPAVSGKGVEVTFDANGRGESEEEFKSGILADGTSWQTLTTEYELKDIEIRTGRLYGTYLSGTYPNGADAIAFGWTNNNEYAGCQMQQLDGNLIRTVDLAFRQNGSKVEVRWVRTVYTRTNASTYYGKKYLKTTDPSVTSDKTSTQIRAYWVSTKQSVVTVNASGANTMTDSAYVVKGDEAHPMEFKATNADALPAGTTDCYGNSSLYLDVEVGYTTGISAGKSAITMHPGSHLCSIKPWTMDPTYQSIALDDATFHLDGSLKYINDLVLTNGAVVTGTLTRVGFKKDGTWRITGEGVATCCAKVGIVAGTTGANGTKRSFIVAVDDTVVGDASDFIMSGDIENDSGYPNGVFQKSGVGTMEMQGTIKAANNPVRVTGGTLLLGKTGAVLSTIQFSLEGGALACAAGTSNEVTKVSVTANSTLAVGSGAALTMTNLTVSNGKTLSIECADGTGPKSVKVTTPLDATTRSRIRLNGLRPSQTSDGYLCIGGFMLIVR